MNQVTSRNNIHPWFFSLLILTLSPCVLHADEPAPIKFGPWEYLYRGKPTQTSISPKLKTNLKFVDSFELKGEQTGDRNRFNNLVLDGGWRITQGALHQSNGRAAMLDLGEAENFELELGIDGTGDGGWFFLFGFDENQGHGLYNVDLRTSGSQWFVIRFARGEGVEGSDIKIAEYECRGKQAVKLVVANGQLSFYIGNRTVLANHELEGYQSGNVYLGTYDTQYGPKPVKFYGIRMRRPVK